MRVAFHFNADLFPAWYGPPITRMLFKAVISCIPMESRHLEVRSGDLLIPQTASSQLELSSVVRAIYASERPIWSTLSAPELESALRSARVMILLVDGLTPVQAYAVDKHLRQETGYLGAIEAYLANRAHWVLYEQQLPLSYRLVGDELRLLYRSLDLEPDRRDETQRELWRHTKLFRSVEWEDIGLRDTILYGFEGFDHARRGAQLEDLLVSRVTALTSDLLLRLHALDPKLSEELYAALQLFATAATEEQLAQVGLSCRRYLHRLADVLYPACAEQVGGRKVGPEAYRNRLWLFIEENFEKAQRRPLHETFQELGKQLDRIDGLANKHVHGSHIFRQDTDRLLMSLLLWSNDVLSLVLPPKQPRIEAQQPNLKEVMIRLISGGD